MPQDGRIDLTVGGHPVDLRVSVLPTMFGESVVMRVLDRSVVTLDLNAVGMDSRDLTFPRDHPQAQRHRPGHRAHRLRQDHHALLGAERAERNHRQADHDRRPDRVRHRRHRAGPDRSRRSATPSPSACGRSCGRTRTRSWWARSATWRRPKSPCRPRLTGHTVFSTLHTNDAPSTVTRLRDMGVPPFLITATVEAILAQRLVRRICNNAARRPSPAPKRWPNWTSRPTTCWQEVLSRPGLRRLQQHRLQGPRRPVRADDHERRPARHDQPRASREELRDLALQTGMVRCATPAWRSLRRRHHDRRSHPRNGA